MNSRKVHVHGSGYRGSGSVISEETRARLFPNIKVNDTSVILTTYTGEQMAVTGEVLVTVTHRQKNHLLTLCVIKRDGPSLIDHDSTN